MPRTFKWTTDEFGACLSRPIGQGKPGDVESILTRARVLYSGAVAWRWLALRLGMGTLLVMEAGCGHPLYMARAAQASAELTRAEQLDAAEKAPYEYYYALEHLRQARREGLEADYAEATALAQVAFDYASRAIQIAQRVGPTPPASSVRVP